MAEYEVYSEDQLLLRQYAEQFVFASFGLPSKYYCAVNCLLTAKSIEFLCDFWTYDYPTCIKGNFGNPSGANLTIPAGKELHLYKHLGYFF